MTLKVSIQDAARPILTQMAKEAGVGMRDMVEIAVYNLIGVYQKDRGIDVVIPDGVDVSK